MPDQHAQAYRSLPREEAISRLKGDYARMMEIFEKLTPEEWSGFMIQHPFMGPLPTLFYPAFHVMDYGVHTWDMHWGLGEKDRKLDERTAGVLVPYMLYALLPSTVDAESAKGVDVEFGIEVSGEWGGKWRATVKDGKFEAKPESGNFEGCTAVFRYDPSDFVLTAFQRFPGGEATGALQEAAADLVVKIVPLPTRADQLAALSAAIAEANRLGHPIHPQEPRVCRRLRLRPPSRRSTPPQTRPALQWKNPGARSAVLSNTDPQSLAGLH